MREKRRRCSLLRLLRSEGRGQPISRNFEWPCCHTTCLCFQRPPEYDLCFHFNGQPFASSTCLGLSHSGPSGPWHSQTEAFLQCAAPLSSAVGLHGRPRSLCSDILDADAVLANFLCVLSSEVRCQWRKATRSFLCTFCIFKVVLGSQDLGHMYHLCSMATI